MGISSDEITENLIYLLKFVFYFVLTAAFLYLIYQMIDRTIGYEGSIFDRTYPFILLLTVLYLIFKGMEAIAEV
ncbi:MAG: hypothetical protein ACXAB7_17410 [Candidatus Kariarchaeaceae archaeon]|jgi:hypothetical protein